MKPHEAIAICIVALAFPSCGGNAGYIAQTPRPEYGAKNIILFIGDGMGAGQIKAAGMYGTGAEGTLSFEVFPYKGSISTVNAEGGVTDSAAAATAMATGTKVSNGVLGVALPGDGMPLETVLEVVKKQGKRTGLVTTTSITHATPAAFASHEKSRDEHDAIAAAYLNESRPDILFGGGGYITQADGKKAGYTWSTTGHTQDNVPAYGRGKGAERVSGNMENTDIFQIIIRSATNPLRND